jgi:CSLREA domain-containing protein
VREDASNISSFAVGNLSVNSLADPGDGTCDLTECTLREAIVAANANAGPDVIGFSVTGTINLTGALPPITDAVAINGPGAAQLTVRRDTGGDYRIFALMVNAPGVVTISGLNITNGLASGSFPDSLGGGIANLASGTANISDCILSGNSAAAGGAVSSVRPDSLDPALTTNITNCVLNNNTAGSGGGIYNDSTLTITHSTLSGNTATTSGDGGGITQLTTGSTVITDSIISGNSALDSFGFGTGGGIHNNSILTIIRSTISGNRRETMAAVRRVH